MTLRFEAVSVDCRAPWQLATFWANLLDWSVDDDNSSDDDLVGITARDPGTAPMLFIQVPEGKSGKNRWHIDLRPDDQEREVERAIGLGATKTQVGQSGDESWVVLADPEGNEFCILTSRRS